MAIKHQGPSPHWHVSGFSFSHSIAMYPPLTEQSSVEPTYLNNYTYISLWAIVQGLRLRPGSNHPGQIFSSSGDGKNTCMEPHKNRFKMLHDYTSKPSMKTSTWKLFYPLHYPYVSPVLLRFHSPFDLTKKKRPSVAHKKVPYPLVAN